jgi:hypothetical protein
MSPQICGRTVSSDTLCSVLQVAMVPPKINIRKNCFAAHRGTPHASWTS